MSGERRAAGQHPFATAALEPRDGIPPVVETPQELERTVQLLAGGGGPVAVDAERASGYRYGHRAYLVQVRRAGAGTALIDPVACPDLSALHHALAGVEAVLHAAGQDLPCLAELGYRPARIFDTELAGRLLGYQRVGLAFLVDAVLDLRLEKGHSAADWSRRPLPRQWLRYAALDVEVLVELRDALEAQLREAGKLPWAREEFAYVASSPAPRPRTDPWRRTSGIHRVRTERGLAVVRELWLARDQEARRRDLSPSRLLPDAAIVEAALAMPRSPRDMGKLPGFAGRFSGRELAPWFRALSRARVLALDSLPSQTPRGDGPPATNRWAERDPAAAKRLETARDVIAALAEAHAMPAENLIGPDAVRRLVWTPVGDLTSGAVAAELRRHRAREWQVKLVAEPLAEALSRLRICDEGSGGPPT